MTNTTLTVEKGFLVIKVKLDEQATPSASGKTMVVATTHGFTDIKGTEGFKLSLNVTKPKE